MSKSVVKHSYIRGKKLTSRALAHLNYIQYRPGDDKEEGSRGRPGKAPEDVSEEELAEASQSSRQHAREFRTPDGDKSASYKFRHAFVRESGRNDVVHKLILSPGDNRVDMDKFVQDVMHNLERAKGQQFRYGYVVHENTDHKHAHVVLLGRDTDNGLVRIRKLDHLRLRAYGDRHLEREYGIARELDKDMEHFARRHGLNPEMSIAESGKRFFDMLDRAEEIDARKPNRDADIWDQIDQNWKKNLGLEAVDTEHDYLGRHSTFHYRGRLSDMGMLYQNEQDRERWKNVQDNCPELAEIAEHKLSELERERKGFVEDLATTTKVQDADKLLEKISSALAKESKSLHQMIDAGANIREGAVWSREEIDLDRVAEKDKLTLPDGRIVTKYESSDHLEQVDRDLRASPGDQRLSKDDYQRLWEWIGTKEVQGERVYGTPPLLERARVHQMDIEEVFDDLSGSDRLLNKILKQEIDLDFMEFDDFEEQFSQINRYYDVAPNENAEREAVEPVERIEDGFEDETDDSDDGERQDEGFDDVGREEPDGELQDEVHDIYGEDGEDPTSQREEEEREDGELDDDQYASAANEGVESAAEKTEPPEEEDGATDDDEEAASSDEEDEDDSKKGKVRHVFEEDPFRDDFASKEADVQRRELESRLPAELDVDSQVEREKEPVEREERPKRDEEHKRGDR